MTEKTEWEVVDAPSQDRRPSLQQLLRNLLGRWWRWKIAGVAVVLGLALTFFLTVAAVFVVGLVTVALISLVVAKLRLWLRSRPGTAIRERR